MKQPGAIASVRLPGEPRSLALARHRLSELLLSEASALLLPCDARIQQWHRQRIDKWMALPEAMRLLALAEAGRRLASRE